MIKYRPLWLLLIIAKINDVIFPMKDNYKTAAHLFTLPDQLQLKCRKSSSQCVVNCLWGKRAWPAWLFVREQKTLVVLVAYITNEEGGSLWRSHSITLNVATYRMKQLGGGGTVSNHEEDVEGEVEGCGLDKCVISPLAILEHVVPEG